MVSSPEREKMAEQFDLILEPDIHGDEPEPPSAAWLVSLLFHLLFMVTISLVSLPAVAPVRSLVLEYDPQIDLQLPDVPPEEFHVDVVPHEKLGAKSLHDSQAAISAAPETGPVTDVPSPEMQVFEVGEIEFRPFDVPVTGLRVDPNLVVKGTAGYGVTGADGAVDVITLEIVESLAQRPTLVVWLFDQSASLLRQRQEMLSRFDRIYRELEVIESSGNTRFAQHSGSPLLTAVVAFGEQVSFPIGKPTNDVEQIKRAVARIARDDSGIERVFTAIRNAANRFKKLRSPAHDGLPERNVLFVVFTDEAGDDPELLDETVSLCTKLVIPVYIVGSPAPFGRRETMVKWVDPDPAFDQTPGEGEVSQGPESCALESIRLHSPGSNPRDIPLDSGFGPFALTRLARETGGTYFSVHPNRTLQRELHKHETVPYSAYIGVFFDTHVMRKYQPDYVSRDEYFRRAQSNLARSALLEAAQRPWVGSMGRPLTRFVYRDEAEFDTALTEAQKAAASIEPQVNDLYEALKSGEIDRPREASPRWQAGFDLAFGRVLAAKARTESYNLMLAKAKRGIKFQNPKNNTWVLDQTDNYEAVSSQMEQIAKKANAYLRRVLAEHPGTPWAYLASQELREPLGWKWTEAFTDLRPPANNPTVAVNVNRPAPRRDEQPRMLRKPPERRPVPRL
jgi:hypothetical protein